MCGLFASLGFEPDTARIDVIHHRGPDGRGWRVLQTQVGPLALGHRRLAIIDLDQRSLQPMSYADERYWLIFNGEIYNYQEIREELKARGHAFRTESDSEVLLQAYAAWGEAALAKFLGMFAFIIWDAKEQTLFAARDRFGIKPLFFYNSSRGVAFGSEIKQLLDLPGADTRRMNMQRTWDFLAAGVTDHADDTMFCGIRQLRGGECVSINLSSWKPGAALPVRQYYEIPTEPGPQMSEQEASERFKELFIDSIRLHLRSDVRVGSCLSGGLDSSSIVAVMDNMLKQGGISDSVHTISACYPNKEVDEKPFMEEVVANTNTTPHYIYPTSANAFDLAEKITWHQDEPYGSTSIYSQYEVFKAARDNHIKVMLDGQGADEQLAGYHGSFYYHAQALLNSNKRAAFAYMVFDRWRKHGLWPPDQVKAAMGARAPAWANRYARPAPAIDPSGNGWMSTDLLAASQPPSGGGFAEVMTRNKLPRVDTIGQLCLVFMKGTSLPMLLRYEDRNSMAHSIEARVPFLDHRLVEFNLSLWDKHKIVGGDTKRVLRSAMRGILPERVRTRHDKLGFATPEQTWFRGPLRQHVIDGVEATLERYPGLLHADETRALRDAALDGRRPLDFTLWRIINLGIWGKVFNIGI
jgi:asparagine synthase (glutamine-hydrolysing)